MCTIRVRCRGDLAFRFPGDEQQRSKHVSAGLLLRHLLLVAAVDCLVGN